jgi:hypothetical protein
MQTFPGLTWDDMWRLPIVAWLDVARSVDQVIADRRSS